MTFFTKLFGQDRTIVHFFVEFLMFCGYTLFDLRIYIRTNYCTFNWTYLHGSVNDIMFCTAEFLSENSHNKYSKWPLGEFVWVPAAVEPVDKPNFTLGQPVE